MGNQVDGELTMTLMMDNGPVSKKPVHLSTALYLPEYDYSRRSVPPTSEVLIAAIPRSGSTAFCLQLWRTGVLGAPLEYLNFGFVVKIDRWKQLVLDQEIYWNEIQSTRTSPNGVFSYKTFVQNYRQLADSCPALLSRLKSTHVVYITREDTLAQAISYATAARSGHWFATESNGQNSPALEIKAIKDCYMSIRYQMACWEQIFSMTETSPFRVTYEEFLRTPSQVTQSVVDHVLGADTTMMPIEIPHIRIQRNARSNEWRQTLQSLEPEWRDVADAIHLARGLRPHPPQRLMAGNRSQKEAAGIDWSPERQVIYLGGKRYHHQGATNTSPTHDLAHLLIGLGSDLPWIPMGDDRTVRVAEYNAVFLEHLLSKLYHVHMSDAGTVESAISGTLEHVKWFITSHYAPFPLSLDEAYSRFTKGIDVNKITALSPYFFDQAARQSGAFMSLSWSIALRPKGAVSESSKSLAFQRSVETALSILCTGPEHGRQ